MDERMTHKIKKVNNQPKSKKENMKLFHGLLNNLCVPFIPENYPYIEKVHIFSKSKKNTIYKLSCKELEYVRDTADPVLEDMQLDYINLILTKEFITDLLIEYKKLI